MHERTQRSQRPEPSAQPAQCTAHATPAPPDHSEQRPRPASPVRHEHGSVLLLVPAGVLVLFVLAAIAVDFALAFLGQRELSAAAAAAANDAAGAAVSDAAYYGNATGDVVIDQGRAQRVVADAIARRRPTGVSVSHVVVRTDGPHVCVGVRGRVPYLFSPIVPGLPRGVEVRGEASATAVVGAEGRAAATPNGLRCD